MKKTILSLFLGALIFNLTSCKKSKNDEMVTTQNSSEPLFTCTCYYSEVTYPPNGTIYKREDTIVISNKITAAACIGMNYRNVFSNYSETKICEFK